MHGVALVIDALDRGGAERVLVSIANGLDPARYRVLVVTTRRPGALAGELAPHVEQVSLGRRSRADLRALRRFADLLDRAQVSIVHTHSHFAAYFVRLGRLGSQRGWAHVVHDHCSLSGRSRSLRLLDRLFLRGADFYFAVSEPLARYARDVVGIPAERLERLSNGVGLSPIVMHPPDVPFTIVQVANIAEYKNQLLSIAVAERLRSAGLEFRWLLAGRTSSDYAHRCRAAVERAGLAGRVSFLGEREDVRALLGSAHVGILTSDVEGLPVALLEYMAAALPVVVTDVGDCGNVVRAARCGRVLAPGDVALMTQALLELSAAPDRRMTMGESGRRHVQRHYGDEAMVRRVDEVYRSLLAGRLPDRPIRVPSDGIAGGLVPR